MINTLLRAVVFTLALMGLGGAIAQTLTVTDLQRLLQKSTKTSIAFTELRESPFLPAPITSTGTLRLIPNGMEKRVETPRPETWRMLSDRLELVGPNGTDGKQILFSQSPALASLAAVMRHTVAGNLVALQDDFRIQLTGDQRIWTAQLQPRVAGTARYIDHVELQGTNSQLQVIIVVGRQGDRTTTRLLP